MQFERAESAQAAIEAVIEMDGRALSVEEKRETSGGHRNQGQGGGANGRGKLANNNAGRGGNQRDGGASRAPAAPAGTAREVRTRARVRGGRRAVRGRRVANGGSPRGSPPRPRRESDIFFHKNHKNRERGWVRGWSERDVRREGRDGNGAALTPCQTDGLTGRSSRACSNNTQPRDLRTRRRLIAIAPRSQIRSAPVPYP